MSSISGKSNLRFIQPYYVGGRFPIIRFSAFSGANLFDEKGVKNSQNF